MTPNLLFDNFELLADAPNGVQKLRELILQLAVQGKLVPQDPNDEPASVLLEKIREEKARQNGQRKLFRNEPEPIEDVPYDLPAGWEWGYLEQLASLIHYGYTASANPNLKEVRLLRITDIQNGKVDWDSVPGCEIDKKTLEGYNLQDGDLLIARTGGTIGKSFLVENIPVCAVFASYLIRVVPSPFMLPTYLKTFLESSLYWKQLYAKSMGTGQPNVNGTSLKMLIVPIPPVAEQHRIVAKVDHLMALCDQLEAKLREAQEGSAVLLEAVVREAVGGGPSPRLLRNHPFPALVEALSHSRRTGEG